MNGEQEVKQEVYYFLFLPLQSDKNAKLLITAENFFPPHLLVATCCEIRLHANITFVDHEF